LSHGIINEVYTPRVDLACTRDFGLIVTDGESYFSEEKRHTSHEVRMSEGGVPAYELINTCDEGRYRIEKTVLTDPVRGVLLQRIRFVPLVGTLADYRLYALLAPHLGNRAAGNIGWVEDCRGMPMLFCARMGVTGAAAVACSTPWLTRSVGFVGTSDGWQDLSQHKKMLWRYRRAENGNIALTGEVNLAASGGEFVISLGFGIRPAAAATQALMSLQAPFEEIEAHYVKGWRDWQDGLLPLDPPEASEKRNTYRASTVVLRSHESKNFGGGIIASLSIPWGFAKGDDDLGGYHLAWPRDLVESAGGLLAAGAAGTARRVLHYLQATQEEDGHWVQNMWLDGEPYWHGVQLDETALPILMLDLAWREEALPEDELQRLTDMWRRAARFIVHTGPVTSQDRWEEDGGYSPFTLAAEIAALLAAADLTDHHGNTDEATYLRETADIWNDSIERWTYVTDNDLARQHGVEGYYVRIGAIETADADSPLHGFVPIKNRPPADSHGQASLIVSPDALALVRFGLRAPDDPRILNTIKVIDALLKVETPRGASWHRYNGDGYGEHEDGRPFDGVGVGRAWPLLTGERAHYELAAGNRAEAERLLAAMEAFASDVGLIPEQVWDAPDIPERELFFGRPSGSAMPLVWAHSEHVKLLRSLRTGRIFDMPPQPVKRYQVDKVVSPHFVWRFNQKCHSMPKGKTLRVEVFAPARVHWSADGWSTVQDSETRDPGLGVSYVDLPTDGLASGAKIDFTFFWLDAQRWEGTNFCVTVE
jgi:glucoamylase